MTIRGNRALRFADRWVGMALTFLFGLAERLREGVRAGGGRDPDFSRILVLKFAALGDTILLLPTIEAIKRAHPSSHLTMMVTPINAEAIERAAGVDEVIRIDARTLLDPLRAWAFVRELRKHRYTLALDFEQWAYLSSLLLYLSGASTRVGFKVRGLKRHLLFTESVEYDTDLHEAEHFRRIARRLDVELDSDIPRLPIRSQDHQEMCRVLAERGVERNTPLVAIHPGCGPHRERKQWTEEGYARIADELIERYGAAVVLTGGTDERELVGRIARRMAQVPVSTAGQLRFWQFAALLSLCDLVICGNTGAMHAAAAVGTPTIALHGPTDPAKWGPLGPSHIVLRSPLPCSPCQRFGHDYRCGENRCMRAISEQEVSRAVRTMMERRRIADCGLRIAD